MLCFNDKFLTPGYIYTGLMMQRQWKDFYRDNTHTRVMMTYGDEYKLAATIEKWCKKGESQNSCFKTGSKRAWGYAVTQQLYTPKNAKKPSRAMDGLTEYFLNSCTSDCSTCDQDENLHFRNDYGGGYIGWPGKRDSYGVAWNSPNNAGITWGSERLMTPRSSDWDHPINFYVRGELEEDLGFQSSKVYQSCFAAKKAGEKKSGQYWVNPSGTEDGVGPKYTGLLYNGAKSKGKFPVYCDMTTDNGGYTLLATIHQSNMIYSSPKYSPNNQGTVHRGDPWFFEAEDLNVRKCNFFGLFLWALATQRVLREPSPFGCHHDQKLKSV